MTADDDSAAYQRGIAEGSVRERLDAHDRKFQVINGQLGNIADRLGEMVLQIQRLGDQQASRTQRDAEVAQALREATSARLATQAARWSPWAKIMTVCGAAAGLIAAGLSIYLATRG